MKCKCAEHVHVCRACARSRIEQPTFYKYFSIRFSFSRNIQMFLPPSTYSSRLSLRIIVVSLLFCWCFFFLSFLSQHISREANKKWVKMTMCINRAKLTVKRSMHNAIKIKRQNNIKYCIKTTNAKNWRNDVIGCLPHRRAKSRKIKYKNPLSTLRVISSFSFMKFVLS